MARIAGEGEDGTRDTESPFGLQSSPPSPILSIIPNPLHPLTLLLAPRAPAPAPLDVPATAGENTRAILNAPGAAMTTDPELIASATPPIPSAGFAGGLSFTFYWAARAVAPPGWQLVTERRPYAVLWLITEGTYSIEVEGAGRECGPGSLVLLPPRTVPRAENRSALPAVRYGLSFEMRVWGELDFFRLYRVPAFRTVRDTAELTAPWDELVAELEDPRQGVSLAAEGWARVLIHRWLSGLEAAGEWSAAEAGDERLAGVLAAIDADLTGRWTLERLAQVMCLSPARVRQLFAQHVGVPPARYVALRRMAHARVLLSGTDLTCVQIAACCGFEDPRHFSRVFHRLTALRPTAYREQARRRTSGA